MENRECFKVISEHSIPNTERNFLIEDKVDGLIYENGDFEDLYSKVKYLVDNKADREKIAKSAYEKMANVWNPAKSYKRMVNLIKSLIETGDCSIYEDGPCSKALPIKQNWYTSKK